MIWLHSVPKVAVLPYDGSMKSNNLQIGTAWPYVALAWLAIGMFGASQTVFEMYREGMHHVWALLFVVRTAGWLVWALSTPCVLWLMQRWPVPAKKPLSWGVHGLACMMIGLVSSAWFALLENLFTPLLPEQGQQPFLLVLEYNFIGNLLGNIILYAFIVGACLILDARGRLARQEADSARLNELLAQSQLAALRLQIEPHFMFNSLNAITGLIREGKYDDAITMIASMGDLLRRVTDQSERHYVALEEEAVFVRKYLDIQAVRFAERLQCRLDIPDALKTAQVPDLILQPLVENAIKHGIAKRAKGGEVRVTAERAGDKLILSVYNDGPLLVENYPNGVGITNARRRLAALYGNASSLVLQNHAASGVLASVSLPYLEA